MVEVEIYFIHRILVHKNTATAFIFRFHLIFRSWFLSDDNLDNFLEELGQIVVVLGAAIHVETSPGLPSRLDTQYFFAELVVHKIKFTLFH